MSLVFHSAHPLIPTLRADVRLFEVEGLVWYGGGCDLTPFYLDDGDVRQFHGFWKQQCDKHSDKASTSLFLGEQSGSPGLQDCRSNAVCAQCGQRLAAAEFEVVRPAAPYLSRNSHPAVFRHFHLPRSCTRLSRRSATATSTYLPARSTGVWGGCSSTTLRRGLQRGMTWSR